jgi:hypothetical protein
VAVLAPESGTGYSSDARVTGAQDLPAKMEEAC